ncbi:signal peptidase II [Edaphobacter aggregans]|uniref:Lipoprotein signal peptidase n=1 Tax=Edaphobacter aggregans TaxID=570835 RepID=A0A3R9WDI8_9BACT|nr:signal peptidase II [Edaphobacter aggregans]RSL14770.1 signal peptidase II [Edaphobacter aggregans]
MSAQYEYPPTEFDPKPSLANEAGKRSYFGLLLAISALVVFIDRITKHVIMHSLPGAPRVVIPGFLRITHVENTGAAFSMFAESATPAAVRKGLILFSLFAVIIVLVMLWRVGRSITLTSVALALILGGAIGNLYDRIVYHYVVDFIEVHIVHYHWPDFNLADSCIVIGACLLMIEIFRPQSQD